MLMTNNISLANLDGWDIPDLNVHTTDDEHQADAEATPDLSGAAAYLKRTPSNKMVLVQTTEGRGIIHINYAVTTLSDFGPHQKRAIPPSEIIFIRCVPLAPHVIYNFFSICHSMAHKG